MGKYVTLDRVFKTAVIGEVIFNRDSDLAFDMHLRNPRPFDDTIDANSSLSERFRKTSLLSDVMVHYRRKHNTEPDDNSWTEFSLFATKAFANCMVDYGNIEFEKDYLTQEGYWEIDDEERKELIHDLSCMRAFVESTDFDKYYLVITYM